MGISDKTRKILWAKSGNRCAFCRQKLVVDETELDIESVTGEECHICAKSSDGPRYEITLNEYEINNIDNLILLCSSHHKLVDDQVETYTKSILINLYSIRANNMQAVAVYAFGIFKYPKEYDKISEFYRISIPIFNAAENHIGFIRRVRSPDSSPSPRFFDRKKHYHAATTLTVWADLSSAHDFIYRGLHATILGKGNDWFLLSDCWPNYVLWWIDSNRIPTREDACARIEHLHNYGSTPYAFNFNHPYNEHGIKIDKTNYK